MLYHPTTEYDPRALLLAFIICADGDPAPYSHGPFDPLLPHGIVTVQFVPTLDTETPDHWKRILVACPILI